ncbi:MAG: GntR family transcriptional regulator [Anaerolineales bacterium]
MADTPKTKKERIADYLREIVISGEVEPGERLRQDELAARFEVSATPIREAIQLLVAEGVLTHSPYKGVQVAEIKMEDVREVYLMRCELEDLITRQAVPNLRLADVGHLRETLAQMDGALQAGELPALRKLNNAFHMRIYQAAAMPLLYDIIRSLWTRFPWDTLHVLPGRAAASHTEHEQILAAIEAFDAPRAGQAMRAHIQQGMQHLDTYLHSS